MADEAVEQAIAHWAHRFVNNGVPLYDFQTTTQGVERWDDWCSAWVRTGERHEALGDEAEREGHRRSAGEHLARAALCYHFGKFLFCHRYDEMRATHERAVAAYGRALPSLDPPGRRVEIPFQQTSMPGHLRLPAGVDNPPVVIVVCGLDSAKEELRVVEQFLLDRGLATLTFDGPGQGESEYDLPITPRYEEPVAAVVDVLEGESSVDSGRIGILGVSLGGHYVIRAAAFEPRIKACVSASGAYSVAEYWDNRPTISKEAFRVRSHTGSYEEAKRFAEQLDLTGVASKVTCPVYVLAGTRDRLVPWEHGRRIAEEIGPNAVLNVVEDGSHVVSNMPYQHRPQTADWLRQQLADAGGSA